MSTRISFSSFADELGKIAAKVPFIHGTHAPFKELSGGVGKAILKNDPNPRGLYTASKTRKNAPGIEQFAREATERRGGSPNVLSGKMDTKKGWRPFNMKPRSSMDVEEARDMVSSLDTLKSKKERGPVWKALNQQVGSWHNPNLSEKLKVTKSRGVSDSSASVPGRQRAA